MAKSKLQKRVDELEALIEKKDEELHNMELEVRNFKAGFEKVKEELNNSVRETEKIYGSQDADVRHIKNAALRAWRELRGIDVNGCDKTEKALVIGSAIGTLGAALADCGLLPLDCVIEPSQTSDEQRIVNAMNALQEGRRGY